MKRLFSPLRAFRVPVLVAGWCLLTPLAWAQWTTESYPLKAGYNAVWLSLDCSDRPISDALNNSTVEEVWQWNADASSGQFTQSPASPVQPDAQWKVWRRTPSGPNTLSLLTANAAYLVKVANGTTAFNLNLKGRPIAPKYQWKGSGVNLVGFPTKETFPTFDTFFADSPVLNQSPPVFFYDGGDLAVNPRRLVNANGRNVTRGHAYWVQTDSFTEYYGPLQVTVLSSSGIDFGSKLNTATIRVKNVTDPARGQSLTATFTLTGSAAAPGASTPSPGVPLRVRGPRDANLQFTYTALPYTTLNLQPGEEQDLILDPNRTQLSVPGQSYASILQVTDGLGHTRIDLPVTAVGTSTSGVWVGAAVLDSVNRVEILSGPEFDAPLGSPNGVGPETTTSSVTDSTTVAGVTTQVKTFDATFDGEDNLLLGAAGISPGTVTVTGPGGTPTYVLTTDYTIASSSRATVTYGGSGYTAAPALTLNGGGGTGAAATAALSARVQGVSIDPDNAGSGGSGYTSAPAVAFIGGGGSGATAVAIISEGLVTDITVTNGGSGYSSPPAVSFSGGGGSGAAAAAEIVGAVGSVTITDGGSGYTAAPVISFSPVNADGGLGASAMAEVVAGSVTGVDVIHKESVTVGSAVQVSFAIQTPAVAGAPEGTTTSRVTSTSKLITLGGKSHYSTKRISTGTAAAAPSLFPVRLILHANAAGAPSLLQQIYLGSRNGISYAGNKESDIAGLVTAPGATPAGRMGRVSSASFPRGEGWSGSGSLGTTAAFRVNLGYNAETNPFVHTYHPDHDNWDERYESPRPEGVESYTVNRDITLSFSPAVPAGISDLTWGVTTIGGTYTETFSGLRAQEISVSGSFVLHQVSEVPALTLSTPLNPAP